jgi:hypothetical protein
MLTAAADEASVRAAAPIILLFVKHVLSIYDDRRCMSRSRLKASLALADSSATVAAHILHTHYCLCKIEAEFPSSWRMRECPDTMRQRMH